jgi:type I restriction enzyme M protein
MYQHLMNYWAETMQDDCYLIAANGWKAETYRVIEKDKKGKEKDRGWACDLVPKALIVDAFQLDSQLRDCLLLLGKVTSAEACVRAGRI